jgi:hypothetical protein
MFGYSVYFQVMTELIVQILVCLIGPFDFGLFGFGLGLFGYRFLCPSLTIMTCMICELGHGSMDSNEL